MHTCYLLLWSWSPCISSPMIGRWWRPLHLCSGLYERKSHIQELPMNHQSILPPLSLSLGVWSTCPAHTHYHYHHTIPDLTPQALKFSCTIFGEIEEILKFEGFVYFLILIICLCLSLGANHELSYSQTMSTHTSLTIDLSDATA